MLGITLVTTPIWQIIPYEEKRGIVPAIYNVIFGPKESPDIKQIKECYHPGAKSKPRTAIYRIEYPGK